MRIEIRIYYEVLEQVVHYLVPLVEKGVEAGGKVGQVPIRLVVRPRVSGEADTGRLKGIYQLTTPDFLITACNDEIEVPLIVGEFSESVLTEDHELQRAIGGIAAALTDAVYLKISGNKISDREHGGKKDFDPLSVARAMQEAHGYHGYVVAKWDTVEGNPYALKRNEQFRSCPAVGASPLAEFVIEQVVGIAVSASRIDKLPVSEDFHSRSSSVPLYADYVRQVAQADSISQTLQDWGSRRRIYGWRRVEVEPSKIIVKINRYSHAADPDRGILVYLSSICGKPLVLTHYSVDGYAGINVKDLVNTYCDEAASEGMQAEFVAAVRSAFQRAPGPSVDITADLVKIREKIFSNKVLLVLVLFSDGIIIHSKNNSSRADVKWDRDKIFNVDKTELLESIASVLGAAEFSAPFVVDQILDSLNEDEITYVNVHDILKPNGFRIVAVSYPGAQGEVAILPNREAGRSQERKYVDVIAWLPDLRGRTPEELALEEIKDVFDKAAVENDLSKILSIKNVEVKRKALNEALARLGHNAPKHIVIGVAFGTQPGVGTTWKPDEVDFIVRVVGNRRWQVAPFGNRMKECFGTTEGDIRLPQRYRIVARARRGQGTI